MKYLPPTYDEFIAGIMAMQSTKSPAFVTEEDCRAFMEECYPGLKERYVEIAQRENRKVLTSVAEA